MKPMILKMKNISPIRKNLLYFGAITIILLTLTFVTGCASGNTTSDTETTSQNNEVEQPSNEVPSSNENDTQEQDDKEGWPEVVRFALLPTEDMEMLGRTYEPFINYLEARLDRPVELNHPTDYTATVEAMRGKHVEISTFGPFSFVLAYQRAGAVPVAVRLSTPEDDPTYESFIITRKDTGIEKLEDLKGKNFAFADPASTSGHLFPKAHIMNEMGLSLDEIDSWFGNTTFSGGHEASFLSVLNGDVDAAAIYDRSFDRFAERNQDHPNIDDMIIIDRGNPIPNSPFTVRGDLPESFQKAVQDAMLDMLDEKENYPGLAEFMEEINALGGYFAADIDAYQIVIDTAERLEMQ
ncbi:phosphate/phosphite/phosphonate ABC transporter substrate-binding protein [Herbivorax sp. ANBcel31]|uniref:phosphate/phosphite/phosphonate ABC transporter substrate-binding protein n=1 Tax=Herbivorax sp. ANBcel31 TaxID=3069754 RepID=UPI0027B2436B|nr:phosphate/phosphite/phosphonate ABC transporter substrate-binding protein [Herbivorax sp. ANBcel31]MDQ2086757.1 phosphate/phosphite/phosphonate ABC transporter substrate-binding protein [Herbivorax sp. ANBcel31]